MSEINHTRDVGLSGIAILPIRMRALRPEVVAALAASMKQQGLLNPITVRVSEASGYYLVAGRHRYEAARKLKWESITARIIAAVDENAALLAEIDENLIRAELSPAERAAHIAKRKSVYEAIHGPAKARGARAAHIAMGHIEEHANADSADAFTRATAKATGRAERTVQVDASRGRALTGDDLSKVTGTSLDKGDELDALAKMSQEARDALIERAAAGEKVSAKQAIKKEQRDTRQKVLAGIQLASPEPIYGCVLEDYEWDFEVYSRDTGMDRHAGNHYPTSDDAHTAAEIVKRTEDRMKCAAPDCVLGMWATVPHAAIAMDVMRLRGFTYKSQFAGVKDRAGTGYWNRNKHEIFLVGTRGKIPAPAMGTQFESVIHFPRGEHSVKPDWQYEFFERHFPDMPKIELNARRSRVGWASWGLDAPTDAAGNVLAHDDYSGEILTDGAVPRTENVTPDSGNLLPQSIPTQDDPILSEPVAVLPGTAAGSPEIDDHPGIPEFLRRESVPVASPRLSQSVSAEDAG